MLRLLRDAPPGARLAGAVVYLWNPYVYERLAIGHWALLCGYACLPWVAAAALAVRRDGLDPARLAGLAIPLAVAAVTSPTGDVLAAGVAGALVLPSVRALAATSGVAVVANLPWLLPGLLHTPGVGEGADAGVAAFAARSDTPYGVVGSVLSLGGMWKTAVAPDPTPAWLFALLSLGITVVALAGVAACRRAGRPDRRGGPASSSWPWWDWPWRSCRRPPKDVVVEAVIERCPARASCGTARSGWRPSRPGRRGWA